MTKFRTLELFAGAGGLTLGLANSGFDPVVALDIDDYAIATLTRNKSLGLRQLRNCNIINKDVRQFQFADLSGTIDVVAGGPPCQPFSRGGNHHGHKDSRDMFPEVVRAVRELNPIAFVLENVTGLLRRKFARYFGYVLLQLTYPEMARRAGEPWTKHLRRLKQHDEAGSRRGDYGHYKVTSERMNAADFGVPQRRERIMLVGIRSDYGMSFDFPQPTHSRAVLQWEKWISGEYWRRHGVREHSRSRPSPERLDKLKLIDRSQAGSAWVTVRDAISGLFPPARPNAKIFQIPNHVLMPGATSYPGHTGSVLDEPSKTLKAGRHGVPGGENMLRRTSGGVRYFTIRECARLQCFPDTYEFEGSWSSTVRQLGNAVPVKLAEAIGAELRRQLTTARNAVPSHEPTQGSAGKPAVHQSGPMSLVQA